MSNKIYSSIYGADSLITPSQYIAELMISRQTKISKLKLPNQFWKKQEYTDWTKRYLNQKRRADALVKSGYTHKAIIRALMSERGEKMCSLFNKSFDAVLEEEQRKLSMEEKVPQTNNIVVGSVTDFKKNTNTNKTKISKLRD